MSKIKVSEFVNYVENELGHEKWIPLFKNLNSDDKTVDGSQYSCLSPIEDQDIYMDSYGWDLSYGDSCPSLASCGGELSYEERSSKFLQLIHVRDFIGRNEKCNEILQELVLYLKLYNDIKNSKYFVDDGNGKQIEVIRYSENEITIRASFLKAFMAAKQMNLLLFFESTFHFNENFDKSKYLDSIQPNCLFGSLKSKSHNQLPETSFTTHCCIKLNSSPLLVPPMLFFNLFCHLSEKTSQVWDVVSSK